MIESGYSPQEHLCQDSSWRQDLNGKTVARWKKSRREILTRKNSLSKVMVARASVLFIWDGKETFDRQIDTKQNV